MGKSHSLVKKHTTEAVPQQFHLCIDYRKVKSLLPAVTPAAGTKKALLPLPKLMNSLQYSKEQSTSQHWISKVVTTT